MKKATKETKSGNGSDGPRSVYLGALYKEIQAEAARLDRSASWLIREAWKLALPTIREMTTKPARV